MTDAYDTLCAAIRDYYNNHKRSAELEKNGQSIVGVLSSPDLSWVMKRGLLDVALTEDRFSTETEDDDD